MFDTFKSLARVALKSKFSYKVPKTKNKELVVIANGPSFSRLYEEKPSFFTGKDCIVCNGFAASEIFNLLKPNYYIWLDPEMSTIDSPNIIASRRNLANVSWPISFLIPAFMPSNEEIDSINKNPNVNFSRYNYVYYKGWKALGHYLFKKQLACPQARTVTSTSIFVGVNMGYKKIYLIGADQDVHLNTYMDERNILFIKDIHFYSEDKPTLREFGMTSADFFNTLGMKFVGYEEVADYAASLGVRVVNLSKNSFIDCFDKEEV